MRIPVAIAALSALLGIAVASCLALTPRPKPRDQFHLVGEWELTWGACPQRAWFAGDGTYSSCRFGGGPWQELPTDEGICIQFTEGQSVYRMWFDRWTLEGAGCRVEVVEFGDGTTREIVLNPVPVRMRRVSNDEHKPKE